MGKVSRYSQMGSANNLPNEWILEAKEKRGIKGEGSFKLEKRQVWRRQVWRSVKE